MANGIRPLPVANIPNIIAQGLGAFQQVRGIQRQEAAADRQKLIDQLSGEAVNDPAKLSQLLALDPARGAQIQRFQQNQQAATREQARFDQETQDRFRRESVQLAAEIEGQPLPNQLAAVNRQIALVESRGGDASDTIRLRNLLAGNPEENNQAQDAIRQRRLLGEQIGLLKPRAVAKPEGRTELARNIELLANPDLTEEQRDFVVGKLRAPDNRTALAKNIDLLNNPNLTDEQKKLILASLSGTQQRVEFRPDGSFVFATGKGALDAGKPTKSVTSALQKQAISLRKDLKEFDIIKDRYNKEFLTLKGVVRSKVADVKSFLGIDVSPGETKFAKERRSFTQPVQQFFNRYLLTYAGVRVIRDELKRQQEAMINNQQSPLIFEAALEEGRAATQRAQRLVNKMLREGVTGSLKNKKSDAAKRLGSLYSSGADDIENAREQSDFLESQGIPEDQIEEMLIEDGYIE